jgi:hypothetical protein
MNTDAKKQADKLDHKKGCILTGGDVTLMLNKGSRENSLLVFQKLSQVMRAYYKIRNGF